MAVGDSVEIPAGVVVRCPMKNHDLRHATKCGECPHFGGLTEMISGGERPFHRRFALNCKFGLDRELFQLAAD